MDPSAWQPPPPGFPPFPTWRPPSQLPPHVQSPTSTHTPSHPSESAVHSHNANPPVPRWRPPRYPAPPAPFQIPRGPLPPNPQLSPLPPHGRPSSVPPFPGYQHHGSSYTPPYIQGSPLAPHHEVPRHDSSPNLPSHAAPFSFSQSSALAGRNPPSVAASASPNPASQTPSHHFPVPGSHEPVMMSSPPVRLQAPVPPFGQAPTLALAQKGVTNNVEQVIHDPWLLQFLKEVAGSSESGGAIDAKGHLTLEPLRPHKMREHAAAVCDKLWHLKLVLKEMDSLSLNAKLIPRNDQSSSEPSEPANTAPTLTEPATLKRYRLCITAAMDLEQQIKSHMAFLSDDSLQVAELDRRHAKICRTRKRRKRIRQHLAEAKRKEREAFEEEDMKADEWRARVIAKAIAKRKMDKMQELAIQQAKEEKRAREKELEDLVLVERLQELRTLRVEKLRRQGKFMPDEDDAFLARVREAAQEEERAAHAAADTNAAALAIAGATVRSRSRSRSTNAPVGGVDGGGGAVGGGSGGHESEGGEEEAAAAALAPGDGRGGQGEGLGAELRDLPDEGFLGEGPAGGWSACQESLEGGEGRVAGEGAPDDADREDARHGGALSEGGGGDGGEKERRGDRE